MIREKDQDGGMRSEQEKDGGMKWADPDSGMG